MINTHIEFAHIYQDKFIEEEQINSILILKKLNLCKENNIFSILIDDYNLKEKKWNNSYLIEKIKEYNVPLDDKRFTFDDPRPQRNRGPRR